MATSFACPKCQSEQVQKISIIVEHGTTEINTESSSAGVGVGFGGTVVGGGKTTTSGTAQTQLAKQFSEELYSESNLMQGIVGIISIALATYVGTLIGGFFHSSFMGWSSGIISFIALAYVGAVYLLKPSDEAVKRQNKKDLWKESGFYCNRCAAKFVPGTDEAYTFSNQ